MMFSNENLCLQFKEKELKMMQAEQLLHLEIEKRKQLERDLIKSEARFKALEDSMISQRRQTQKMEIIGTLASGIAHDFNNILSVISGNCELALLKIDADSPLRPHLTSIIAAWENAKALVQQILTISRKIDDKQNPTLIHVVLKETLKLLRASIPATIEFRLDICRDKYYVMADVVQMYQIFVILCVNAAQAMQEEGGTLTVKLSQHHLDLMAASRFSDLKPGSYLKLDISDTGKGFTSDTLKHLFIANHTKQGPNADTDLGLLEIQEIVELHKGEINVYSQLGRGTTFSIFLPIIESESLIESNKIFLFQKEKTNAYLLNSKC